MNCTPCVSIKAESVKASDGEHQPKYLILIRTYINADVVVKVLVSEDRRGWVGGWEGGKPDREARQTRAETGRKKVQEVKVSG